MFARVANAGLIPDDFIGKISLLNFSQRQGRAHIGKLFNIAHMIRHLLDHLGQAKPLCRQHPIKCFVIPRRRFQMGVSKVRLARGQGCTRRPEMRCG